ncbi:IS5 family transposase [Novosphingobium sp.]|uniref:IS5 family transposase n=1 Tax=Novosphingobium sp. TaxID=1874826 RepID=UPI0022C76B6F|nr:IS5 family transposase [Novosphingobium sp.]MCZ8075282.1 IS5 family transposase [Roseateles sp.]MCZ8085664.1 IS5 family transposase [Paracoccaceae bacterium]MCZ8255823.1 IS5 family transposase [Polaromonas sp.]MCZ8036432.1 IS5 family transposase [Novosphingobium sp.]MCZ8233500.1 IS5 family transposase [Novosphingobium sp.]
MPDVWLLGEAQMRRIEPFFPLSHGVPRVDDRRVISGIIFVLKNGLRWRDAPAAYGPHKTIYNRFIRWSRLGVFNRIFAELAAKGGKPDRLMIDATHLKAHRTAASLLKKGSLSRCIGRTKGGLNSKLHAVTDGQGRPVVMLLTEGQASDYRGAALLLNALPPAKELIADKGYDGNGFRNALAERGIAACIPSKSNRKIAIPHDTALYRQRHKIEIMFGRLKDWRRIHTRYDRCAHAFFSAICIAATVIFWLGQ